MSGVDQDEVLRALEPLATAPPAAPWLADRSRDPSESVPACPPVAPRLVDPIPIDQPATPKADR